MVLTIQVGRGVQVVRQTDPVPIDGSFSCRDLKSTLAVVEIKQVGSAGTQPRRFTQLSVFPKGPRSISSDWQCLVGKVETGTDADRSEGSTMPLRRAVSIAPAGAESIRAECLAFQNPAELIAIVHYA